MLHQTDLESILRATGLETVPKWLEDEYELWLTNFHKAFGSSGPLGSLLIPLLDKHELLKPIKNAPQTGPVDWRSLDADGSVRVEVNMFGTWMGGRYFGLVEHGTLAVRLDDSEETKEMQPHVVRLAEQVSDDMVDIDHSKGGDEDLVFDDEVYEVKWDDVAEGSDVYVETSKGAVEGKFIRVGKNDHLVVEIDGNRRGVSEDKVALVLDEPVLSGEK